MYVTTVDKLMESLKLLITESAELSQHPRGPGTECFLRLDAESHWYIGMLLPQYLYLTTLHNFNTLDLFYTYGHKGKVMMGPGSLMGKTGSQS